MMYLALFYDYWVIDGSIFVIFLVKVKEYIEDLVSMLFDLQALQFFGKKKVFVSIGWWGLLCVMYQDLIF